MANDKLAILQAQVIINDLKNVEIAARSLNNTFKDTVKITEKISKQFNTGRIKEYTNAIRDLNSVTQQYVSIERQLADSMMRTARLERELARVTAEQNRARREAAEALRAESLARQQAAREAAAQARANRDANSAYAQLTRQTREARQNARDYGAQIFQLKEKLRQGSITQQEYNNQIIALQRNYKITKEEAIRLQRELNKLNQETSPQRTGALQGRVTDILKSLTAFVAVDNIASYFMKIGTSYKDTAIKLETLRLSQKAVFKTNEEVARQNVFLTDISQKYGVELMSLSKAYNNFSASAQGTTLEGEKSKVIFDAVAKSSAMLGVTTDDTNGILRALGQMMSKGKVQAEELRGQLGDRMAGAFRLFADGIGVSTAQLDAMLKKGEVIAEDVLPKFAEQLNKKYKLGINEEVLTSQAAINRLTNSWTIFVDAVENRSNIVGSSVSAFSAAISGLLKEMTPSQFITDIQKQQAEFNQLGIILKQNFSDTSRRKELIDQMIALNPYWLDGLDKESITLDQINERLMITNQQYLQKIILQKSQDELNELLEEQAERIGIIAQAYADNAEAINKLSPAQYNVMQSFTDGKITLDQAYTQLTKLGVAIYDVQELFESMDAAVNKNRLTSKGWIGTTKSIGEQVQSNSDKYNGQIKVLGQIIKTQGNLLGINTSMINLNYKLGDSIDYLSVKQQLLNKKKDEEYQKTIKAARELKQAYTSFNGFFFDAKTAKNTGKKVGEWDIVDNKLVKRVSAGLPDKETKPKASTLRPDQKDAFMIAQGQRDYELAANEKNRLDLKIGYEDYLQEKTNIAIRFDAKLKQFLKGANAKEIQLQGAAYKKLVYASVQSNKELYDDRSKTLETVFKREQNILDRQSRKLDQDKTISDVDRLNQQIEIDGQMIKQINDFYEKSIKLASNSAQRTIELERSRDEEIANIEDQRLQRFNSLPEAIVNSIETQAEITQSKVDANFEDQKSLILKDKSLSIDQQAYKLSQLEKDLQIEKNKEEIKRLELLEAQIIAQQLLRSMNGQSAAPTPEEEKKLAEYDATKKNLRNQNIKLGADKNSEVAPEWLKTKDVLVKGLQDMGMGNFASAVGNQFDELYKKIIDGSLSAKDAVVLAASAMADGLSNMVNSQKEKTIAALDEQLKYSQQTTEQEVGFINGRLEALNALGDLTEEQMIERNRLEDEARVRQDQQRQREKLIETQKARAEQKAAAQQALINAALGATMALATQAPPASYIMAGLSLAFGIAQSVSIMSKDPVPKYWKGRKGGKAEFADTQEFGPEMITSKEGQIKTLGSGTGTKRTWLDEGDVVYTADQTKRILKTMGSAKIGSKVFSNIARQSMVAPEVSIVNSYRDNSSEIARKTGREFRRELELLDKPIVTKEYGKIIKYSGRNYGVIVGEYDLETGKEKWYGNN